MPAVQRLTSLLFAWVIMVLGAGVAIAQPSFGPNVSPSTIGPGASSNLTYTITNGSSSPVTGGAFDTTLPSDLTFLGSPIVAPECIDATVSAPSGGTALTVSGLKLGPETVCTIELTLDSTVAGSFPIVSSDLTSSAGNSGPSSATLTVDGAIASFTKALSPASIAIYGTSTITYTIDNSSGGTDVGSIFSPTIVFGGASFSETLKAGLSIAPTPNVQTSVGCAGASQGFPTNNSAGSTISFLNVAVAAGDTCTISIDVLAENTGTFDLLSDELSYFPSNYGKSFAQLAVAGISAPTPQIQKFFVDDPVNRGGIATVEYILSNSGRDFGATNISFTDDFDAMLSGATLVASSIPSSACGGTISGTSTLSFSGGMLGAPETCRFAVEVNIPSSAPGGSYPGTTSTLSATVDGATVAGNQATDTLVVRSASVPQPIFTKEFTDDPVVPGDQATIRYTIDNSGSAVDVTDLAFTDVLEFLSTETSLVSGTGSNLCGAGSAVTYVAFNSPFSATSPTIGLTSGTILAGATCSFDIVVQTQIDELPGSYSSTSGALSYNDGASVVSGPTATDTFVFSGGAELSLSKVFGQNSGQPGQTVSLTFTVDSAEESLSTATAIAFSDDLDAFHAGSTFSAVTANTCGGTAAGLSTGSFSYSGGTVDPASSCLVTIDVILGAGDPNADVTNTSSTLTATAGGEPTIATAASDTLYIGTVLPLTLSMEFPNGDALPGETIQLDFTLTNPNTINTATSGSLTVNLSGALSGLATTGVLPADPCGAGSSLSGTTFLILSGAEIAPAAVCNFSVNVLVPAGATDGTYPVVSSQNVATIDGANRVGNAGAAQLVVQSSLLEIEKSFANDLVAAGDSVDLTFRLTNTSDQAVSGLSFTDDLDAMLSGATASAVPGTVCNGGSVTGTSSLTFSGGGLAAGAFCEITVTVNVPAAAVAGEVTNTSSAITGSIGAASVSGAPASASFNVSPAVDLTFSKSFGDLGIPAGGSSLMTIGISNTSVSASASGVSFTDDLSAMLSGMSASGHSASAGCGGGSFSGSSLLTFSGGSIAAGDTCTLTATVTAPSGAAVGSYSNTTSQLYLSGVPAAAAASASLTIVPPPSFTKEFSDNAFAEGGTTTITFTIANSASNVAATALDFTDTLSAGFTVASVPAASTTCTGGTLTAVAGAGTVSYTGGSVAAGATCTVVADVTASTAGFVTNTTGALTSSLGNSGTASDTVTVVAAPSFAKAFSPQTLPLGFVSTLTFTVDNSTSILAATGLGFSDTLPAGVIVASPSNASTTCTGGTLTAAAGGGTISYSGGTAADSSACTVQVDVTSSATGSHVNTSGALTSSLGNSGTANATLTVVPQPTFGKAFGASTAIVGASTTLTFTINNTSPLTMSAIDFTDTLPAGMVVAATPNATTSCTGGTLTATAGAGVISYTGGSHGPNLSCTVAVDVTTSAAGDFNNTSGALTSSLGNSGTASASLRVNPAPSFAKSFRTSPIGVGLTSTMSFEIDNSGSTVAATGLGFTDALPAGMIVATPANASSLCTGGSLTATAGSGSVIYAGGSVAAGATCSITVDVTTTASGSLVNTTGDLTSSLGNSGTATSTLVAVPQPGFAKVFSPDSISLGQSSTLTFTIDNSGSVLDANALGFADTLPTNLVVAATPNAATTCTGGTFTAAAGSGTVSYSAGSVAASGSCTLSVDVTPASAGAFDNTSGALTSSLGTSGAASDTLTVVTPEIGISGSIGGAVVDGGTLAQGTPDAGAQQTLVLTITNTGTEALSLDAAPVISAQTNVVVDSVVGPVSTTVPVNGSTTVTVLYTPATAIQTDPTVDQAFSFVFGLGNSDVDEAPFDFTVSGTAQDVTAPTGYSVSFDQNPVTLANQTAASFTFASAEVGADFAYSITSDGGGAAVTGTGTVASATDQISGLDLSGLGDGTLTLSVTLTDAASNAGTAATDTTTKDATAPAGYSVSFDQGAVNSANETAVSFSFAGAEVGSDFAFSISSDAGAGPVTGTGTIATMTHVVAGLNLSGLGDGTLTLTVALTDPAGNAGMDVTDTIAKDTVAPALSIDTPVSADGLVSATEAAAIEISGGGLGLAEGAVVTVVVSDGAAGLVSDSATITGGLWSVTLNLTTLADGALNLTADALDAAGNPAPQATATATLDTVAPSGYAVAFVQDPVNIANQTAIDLTVTGAEVGAVVNVAITSDGGAAVVTLPGVTASAATVALTGVDLSTLADGTLTASTILTDAAGNLGTAATGTTTKDTVAPALTITTPLADDDVINDTESLALTVSGTSTDLADGAGVTVTVTDSGAGFVSGTGNVTGGAWSVTLDVSMLADGSLSFAADASDAANNPAPQATATATKDTGIPTVAFDTPIAGDDLINNTEAGTVTVSGTATGVLDGATVSLVLNNATPAVVSTQSVTVTAGVWSQVLDLSALDDGDYTFTADISDAAGNAAVQASATLTKDTTAPSIEIADPDPGVANALYANAVDAAEAAAFAASGTALDAADAVQVVLTATDSGAGSVSVTTGLTAGPAPAHSWADTLDLSGLADGAITLTAVITDVAGNSAMTSTSFLKDTTAPAGYTAALDQVAVNSSNQTAASFSFAAAEVGPGVPGTDVSFDYTITSDGGGVPVTGTGTIASATDQVTGIDVSGLADGTLTLSVTLTDFKGNTGAAATDTANKDVAVPTATLVGPITPQSDPFSVTLSFSEAVTGLDLTSVSLVNGTASALAGSGADYSFTVTPDHDGIVEISLDAGAALDGAGNPSTAAAAINVTAELTGTPNPTPLPDADGDGVADIYETGDRDGDGISDAEDFDPQGYFYCEDDGRIIPGGGFTVTGPAGSNGSLGVANFINITRDGSTGEMQWFAQRPGSYSVSLTYPTSVGVPSTTRLSSGTLDLTTLLPANPAVIGSTEFGTTGYLADASLAANPVFYTNFVIEAGDPFVLSNNIPMTQCAENLVTLTASTGGAEANGGTPTDPTFTISMGRASTQATVIAYSVAGTAVAGTDFTALSGSVAIPAGDTSATVTVSVLEDGDIEGPETVSLTLTGVTSGDLSTAMGTTVTGSATIVDDDFADFAVVNVDLVTNEGGGDDATMTFALLGAPSSPVTLSFAGDSQCTVAPATITFTSANFAVPQALTIRAIDDDRVEGTHSCQPTVTVGSADTRFDGAALALAAVSVTDDLVDQIREPLTEILEDDLAETITTQTKAFSRIAKGALQRLQAGRDLPCGTVEAFDVDGSVDIQDAAGSARGTFGSDGYNCVTDTREIVDGTFSVNKTDDTGVQALLQFAWQRERFVTDDQIAGYFLGGYYSRTDVSGLGDGSIDGFGVNGGIYGARSYAQGLFLDYYVAGAAGRHKFDIDFDAATAPINATGQYSYLAGFAGLGVSGEREFDTFVIKPRIGVDLAYAKAGDADVTARQLGLTDTGIIDLDDFSGARATAEIRFESLATPGGAEALAAMMRTSVTPRFTCEMSSYDEDTNCGVGLAFAWERSDAANGLTWGFEVDGEKIDDSRRFTFNIKREQQIANGLGVVVTRLSMPEAQTMTVEHGIKLDF